MMGLNNLEYLLPANIIVEYLQLANIIVITLFIYCNYFIIDVYLTSILLSSFYLQTTIEFNSKITLMLFLLCCLRFLTVLYVPHIALPPMNRAVSPKTRFNT